MDSEFVEEKIDLETFRKMWNDEVATDWALIVDILNTPESITPFQGVWCNSGVILSGVLHQSKQTDTQMFNILKTAKV